MGHFFIHRPHLKKGILAGRVLFPILFQEIDMAYFYQYDSGVDDINHDECPLVLPKNHIYNNIS